MKRSEINKLIREAIEFFNEQNFHLPPWGYWAPDEWQKNVNQISAIAEVNLGWDVTDFGMDDFYKKGLLLFTIRNGKFGDSNSKSYAEKIMIVRENQLTPWHFHWHKTEDIINRGGGNLVVELCHSTSEEELESTPITVETDGIKRSVNAKGKVVLKPGESITLPPYLYHQFYGESGKGWVLVGEVSSVNEDKKDNRFYDMNPRFPEIDENEPPQFLLCTEYPTVS